MTIGEMQRLVTGKGAGETQEDLLKKNNEFLNSAVNFLASSAAFLGISNSLLIGSNLLLGEIYKNTAATAIGTGITTGILGKLSPLLKLGLATAAVSTGVQGAMLGRNMVKEGNVASGIGSGAMSGALATLLTGALLLGAIPSGGASLALLAGGAALGGGIAATGMGDDVISRPGYGERMLVTPNHAIALNDKDNVVAYANDMVSNAATTGVQMLSYGELGRQAEKQATTTVNVDLGKLEQKLDAVIRSIGSMKVEMDGTSVGKILASNEARAATYGPIRSQRA
jgi:hypothetical protein